MILRTMIRNPIKTPNQLKQCEVCGESTREGKPFCPEHVERNAYVRNILQALEDQEKEHTKALKKGTSAIANNSLTAIEMVKVLAIRGTTTVNRIAREVNLDLELVEVYARYLGERRITRSGTTTRGNKTLTLRKK